MLKIKTGYIELTQVNKDQISNHRRIEKSYYLAIRNLSYANDRDKFAFLVKIFD